MTAVDPGAPPVKGHVNRDGRLVAADEQLEQLNAQAGGAIGQPIAVPQIATLARLAQRLRILVSRGVFAADGARDIELWVRAAPEDDGVRLAVTGWQERPDWRPSGDSSARAADLQRSAADWLWETDTALRLTFVTLSAGAKFGFDAAGMLGQPLTHLFALGEESGGDLPILGALALRRRFDDQPACIRATGAVVRLAATPRSDASGAFAGFSGAVRMAGDTERRTGRARKDSVDGLSDAFGTRLDQALRTPLGRIIANADSIHAQSEGPLRQDYADYAADIAGAGRHLLGLVDDLVDLHAIERSDFAVAADEIDLADIARRAAGLLSVRSSNANVSIDKPASGDTLPATGEFRRVLQILVNLVGNAVRYTPDGGTVWLRTEREGDVAVVVVADQGKGIAVADQERIFEKFERVDTREIGGNGLGLYIARRLARAMGGNIAVKSAPGQGARFVLTLPLRS